MIIDTHCHLDFNQFDSDRDAVIERARKSGVNYIINVGSSLEGSKRSVELAQKYENIFASIGIHPHDADNINETALEKIAELASEKKVVAIGEVGLDYFKSPSSRENQKALFVKSIELSKKLKLPLVVHNRDASKDTLDVLKSNLPFGVMHCFSGDKKFLNEVLDLGLYVSFTCNLTFKNAKNLKEVAKYVPLDKFLLETDAPFLAPQAYRGKRNEPVYITELRDLFAGILNLSKEEVERKTTENAIKLFKLPIK